MITPLLFYFIVYIPRMRSILYNSYAISHLVIIIIIQSPTHVYITPTYLRHNITLLIPIVTLAHHTRLQIRFLLIPQLAAMIICPTVNEYIKTNVYIFVTHSAITNALFLAWLNLKTRIESGSTRSRKRPRTIRNQFWMSSSGDRRRERKRKRINRKRRKKNQLWKQKKKKCDTPRARKRRKKAQLRKKKIRHPKSKKKKVFAHW